MPHSPSSYFLVWSLSVFVLSSVPFSKVYTAFGEEEAGRYVGTRLVVCPYFVLFRRAVILIVQLYEDLLISFL